MSYRDDLQAAQERIRKLEDEMRELKSPPKAEATPAAKTQGSAGGCWVLFVGLFLLVLVFGGSVTCGLQGCLRTDSQAEVALDALRKCPRARELLGEDIGWSAVGCTNYKSKSGGDPLNGGCSGHAGWTAPVSGSKGRGSYVFSSSKPAGGKLSFTNGTLSVRGEYVIVQPDGTCTSTKQR